MAYASVQDLIDRFGEDELIELTDTERTGQVDQAQVETALEEASAEIDALIRRRYSVPVSPAPALLRRLCADIARYHLDAIGGREHVAKRRNDAVKRLESIAAGRATLDGGERTGAGTVHVSSKPRRWSGRRVL
ncbi:gp436 family protein [Arhodomonas sp. AD133]|uniref:gp436 family protein n=1 Tax=Arhodomonas sp. AD133 TaxID=3415009 RepID=UPI003EB6F8A6